MADKTSAVPLDESILEILGDDNNEDVFRGPEIHATLAEKWQTVIKKGMSSEVKKDLIKRYPFAKNCTLLKAPILNPEIRATMSETVVKRDSYQAQAQNLIGTGLSALGIVISQILDKKILAEDDNSKAVLTTLSDSARIFSELFHSITKTRQAFITPSLSKSIRPAAYTCVADSLLYGEKLNETIKNAQIVEKCGKDIKDGNSGYNSNKFKRRDNFEKRPPRNLNSAGPFRRPYRDFRQNGPKSNYRRQSRRRQSR